MTVKKKCFIGVMVSIFTFVFILFGCISDWNDGGYQEPAKTGQLALPVSGPEIHFFTVSPESGVRDRWFTFSWQVINADSISIEPAICDPDIELPLEGSIAGQVRYSTWFTLHAYKDETYVTKQVWVETVNPDGSDWRSSRANMMNTARSSYAGPKHGNLQWKYVTDSSINGTPLIGLDGSAYISGISGDQLYSINPDGSLKWITDRRLGEFLITAEGMIVGIVYNYDYYPRGEHVVALRPDGSIQWERPIPPIGSYDGNNLGGILESFNEVTIVGCMDQRRTEVRGRLVYLNSNGEIEYGMEHLYTSSFTLVAAQPIAITRDMSILTWSCHFPNADHFIDSWFYKGGWNWSHSYSGGIIYSSHLLTTNTGHTYYRYEIALGLNENTGIRCFDEQGLKQWALPGICVTKRGDLCEGGVGTIYAQGYDCDTRSPEMLYAIHRDGWIKWKTPVPGEETLNREYIHYTGPIVDANEYIYCSTKTTVNCYNADGELIWTYRDEEEDFKGLSISMDNILFVTGKNSLYAFAD